MVWISDPAAWMALLTLTVLEIVLGIDNIIFISILVSRLPEKMRDRARKIGLGLAMLARIILLLAISWVMGLTADLFSILNHGVSGRDLILILGGVFLLWKSTHEIHHSLEEVVEEDNNQAKVTFGSVLIQIAILDIVFSLDSVITAVGMAEHIEVMILAVIISVGVMMVGAAPIGQFVEENPTFKILALSFLLMVGISLIAEGLSFHIPKGYIYFSMAFSAFVEFLNLKMKKSKNAKKSIKLKKKITQ